jgi:hypothetical protein
MLHEQQQRQQAMWSVICTVELNLTTSGDEVKLEPLLPMRLQCQTLRGSTPSYRGRNLCCGLAYEVNHLIHIFFRFPILDVGNGKRTDC